MLSKRVGQYGNDRDKHLPYVLFVYHVAVQDSTKSSPFYLLYGQHPRVPTDSALDHPQTVYQINFEDFAEELAASLSDAWQIAHENVRRAQAKQRAQCDTKRAFQSLSVGDHLMVHMPGQVQGKAWKFTCPYFAPKGSQPQCLDEALSLSVGRFVHQLLHCKLLAGRAQALCADSVANLTHQISHQVHDLIVSDWWWQPSSAAVECMFNCEVLTVDRMRW